jgi:hypothetical protein
MATSSVLDRVVQWNLDYDGDLYGDERERYRWYEGIAAASSLQSVLIPAAAAIMVWPLGKPSVLPLTVVLVGLWLPLLLSTAYVRGRRVETTPRSWSAKRILVTVVTSVPYLVFVVGAMYVYDPHGDTWRGALVGGVFGGLAGVIGVIVKGRRRARLEALAGDED